MFCSLDRPRRLLQRRCLFPNFGCLVCRHLVGFCCHRQQLVDAHAGQTRRAETVAKSCRPSGMWRTGASKHGEATHDDQGGLVVWERIKKVGRGR